MATFARFATLITFINSGLIIHSGLRDPARKIHQRFLLRKTTQHFRRRFNFRKSGVHSIGGRYLALLPEALTR